MSKVKIDDAWYEVPDPVVARMGEYYTTMKEANKRYDELKAAIQLVRDKQKLYFKTKAYNVLDESKAAEKALDDILSGRSSAQQAALF